MAPAQALPEQVELVAVAQAAWAVLYLHRAVEAELLCLLIFSEAEQEDHQQSSPLPHCRRHREQLEAQQRVSRLERVVEDLSTGMDQGSGKGHTRRHLLSWLVGAQAAVSEGHQSTASLEQRWVEGVEEQL